MAETFPRKACMKTCIPWLLLLFLTVACCGCSAYARRRPQQATRCPIHTFAPRRYTNGACRRKLDLSLSTPTRRAYVSTTRSCSITRWPASTPAASKPAASPSATSTATATPTFSSRAAAGQSALSTGGRLAVRRHHGKGRVGNGPGLEQRRGAGGHRRRHGPGHLRLQLQRAEPAVYQPRGRHISRRGAAKRVSHRRIPRTRRRFATTTTTAIWMSTC